MDARKRGRKGDALKPHPRRLEQPEEKQVGTTMFAVLLVNKERWTEAAYVAASPHVEPRAKLYIAQQLRENGYPLLHESSMTVCPAQLEEWGCASVMRIPKGEMTFVRHFSTPIKSRLGLSKCERNNANPKASFIRNP